MRKKRMPSASRARNETRAAGLLCLVVLSGILGCSGRAPVELLPESGKAARDAYWRAVADGAGAFAGIREECLAARQAKRQRNLVPGRMRLLEALSALRPAGGRLPLPEFEQPAQVFEIAATALERIIEADESGNPREEELGWTLFGQAEEEMRIALQNRIDRQSRISPFRLEFQAPLPNGPMTFRKIIPGDPASTMASFWMSVDPVTPAQVRSVLKTPGTAAPETTPAKAISGDDAAEFCRKLTARMAADLPPDHAFRPPSAAECTAAGVPPPDLPDQPGGGFRVVLAPLPLPQKENAGPRR